MATTKAPSPAEIEMASRLLSRRRLLPFVQRMNPKYTAGWVHEDICRRLEQFTDDVVAGKSPRLMLLMPPRSGKLLADDTPVPTTSGWKTHGTLLPGDQVFGPDGEPTEVIAVSDPAPADIRVELSNGEVFYCHEDHEWTLHERTNGEWSTRETRWLMQGIRGPRKLLSGNRCMYQLPVAQALKYPSTEFTMHPYVLGAWLGDGSMGEPCLTHNHVKQPVIDKVAALGYPVSTVCRHTTTGVDTTYFSGPKPNCSGRMTLELQQLGVYNAKRIPEHYQRLAVELRLELLAGLVDTDGTTDEHSRVMYSSARKELADDVVELVQGLGMRPYLQRVEPVLSTSGIQGRQVIWVVGFQPTMSLPCVVAHKKVARFAPQRRVGFVSAVRDPRGKTGRCIQVARTDGLYVVGSKMTVTHNSELASRMFPAWFLGRNPDLEMIACSYNVSLAMSFSKKVKETLEDPAYHPVFEARLNPNNQSAEEWSLDGKRGGYVAAGVGGGITGKGCSVLIIDDPCVAQGSRVRTQRGLVPIEHVLVGDLVWTHRNRWKPVVATFDNGVKPVIELSASAYKISLTPEHLVYTSSGWVSAAEAKDVYGEELSAVWGDVSGTQQDPEILQRGMLGDQPARSAEDLPSVRGCVPAKQRFGADVLQRGVSSHRAHDPKTGGMSALREGVLYPLEAKQVLQHRMPSCAREEPHGLEAGELLGRRTAANSAEQACRSGFKAQTVRRVRKALQAVAHIPTVLFARVQKLCTLQAYERRGQLELPAWAGGRLLQQGVQKDPRQAGASSLQGMHAVRGKNAASCASPGRGQDQQRSGQPGVSVSVVPHKVSQIRKSGAARVYDLTVEEDHSFVAEGLVVHNCKNAEEADSADTREKLWDWYGSTAYTRLAPGGGVLVVQTHWHDDDLAGRLKNAMADPDSDQFVVVKYPAIAESDEYLDYDSDLIVYDAAPANGRLLRNKGDALHPERYDIQKLTQIKKTISPRFWSALYQQNPVPDDGSFFTKDQFRRGQPPQVHNANVYIAWDFAISERKQNDYTVGTVALQDNDDVLHFVDQSRFKSGDAFFIVEAMLNLASKWYSPTLVIGVEDGQIYRAIEALLKKRMRERKFYPSIQVLKPLTDKLARARPLQGRMQQGMVSFSASGDWYDSLRSEMLRFPAGAHDDQVDSASWCTHLAIGREAPRKTEAKPMKSWRDKLGSFGGSTSYMAA